MPRQNRVQPTGDILAHAARGHYMGNRGILHDDTGELQPARWRHKAWITCVLAFKNRRRKLLQPGNYTELFFHDEAVAFAAGHRPCGECRRADYNRFRDALNITRPIKEFDVLLHDERAVPRKARQRYHQAEISDLPDGAFILSEDAQPLLLWQGALLSFAPGGYGAAQDKPATGCVTLLTPPRLVTALRAGYTLDVRT